MKKKQVLKFIFIILCFFIMYKIHASDINVTGIDISYDQVTCEEIVGPNLVSVIHLLITVLRLAGAIIAIISGMLTFVPAVVSDNADALKKAYKKAVTLLIILVLIGIFPSLIGVIGKIAGFDTTCL